MSTACYGVNIHNALNEDDPAFIGEKAVRKLIEGFSCPPNAEVEHFLKRNAIEFTKKNQSVTYLVFQPTAKEEIFVGYFTLAVKPVSIRASVLSRTMEKKLLRVSTLNRENGTYTASAYLIAQLGKNFSLPPEKRISGTALLGLADMTVKMARHIVGGVVEFLECEDTPFLLDFYARNGFKAFDRRTAASEDGEEELVQLLRFI
ncbi:MAG: GNAT family acetyltransferase [Selenomonadaceae bacterium]|nr:GNAT family acetyltransferase [Selenomonadaceae bacterium]